MIFCKLINNKKHWLEYHFNPIVYLFYSIWSNY